jgi:hypothetical protein
LALGESTDQAREKAFAVASAVEIVL